MNFTRIQSFFYYLVFLGWLVSEELITHEESGEYVGSAFDVGTQRLYEMMYNAIVNDVEMTVKPEHAAMIIGVIEEVHAANPLPVKF